MKTDHTIIARTSTRAPLPARGPLGHRGNRGGFARFGALTPAPAAAAFTLVEILIVVVIIGILATIVIPQFSDASHQARENALKDDLRYMRTQIGVYKAQHRDVPPGYPGGDTTVAPTLAAFASQMTLPTNELGQDNPVTTPVFKYGPYINRMPKNPLNGLDTVAIVAAGPMPAADDSTGWIYQPQMQAFIANTTGNDANGTPYSSY